MSNKIRHYLAILLLCSASAVQAMQGLFYQPQSRDMAISEARWQEIMVEIRHRGFDTLIVQWTQFGKTFSTPEETAWLQQRLEHARNAGLNLILGLHADPDFFQNQNQANANMGDYLGRLATENQAQATAWIERLGAANISGWYLPAEMDDANWRTPTRQAQAETYLKQSVADLNAIAERPIYLTSFFTGKMSPQAYRDMLARFSKTGVNMWVQTGEGTGALSSTERKLYLDTLIPCEGIAQGIVRELFIQTSQAEKFQAVPAPPDQQAILLATPATCGPDRIFFSLRYLQGFEDMLR